MRAELAYTQSIKRLITASLLNTGVAAALAREGRGRPTIHKGAKGCAAAAGCEGGAAGGIGRAASPGTWLRVCEHDFPTYLLPPGRHPALQPLGRGAIGLRLLQRRVAQSPQLRSFSRSEALPRMLGAVWGGGRLAMGRRGSGMGTGMRAGESPRGPGGAPAGPWALPDGERGRMGRSAIRGPSPDFPRVRRGPQHL